MHVVDQAHRKYHYELMSFLSLMAASTIAKALNGSLYLKLPKTNQIPVAGVQYTAQISFSFVAIDTLLNKGNLYLATDMIGTKGLICVFLVAFIVPNIYYFCFKHNVTITLPDAISQNIAQAFKNIIPFALATTFFWSFKLIFRALTNMNLAAWIIKSLTLLFTAADGYVGLTIIYGAMAFFWFIGIQGPPIIEPAVTAIYLTNVEANSKAFNSGNIQDTNHILSQGIQMFVATLGGTGATLVVTFRFDFYPSLNN